jgi:hypothetical protein
MCKKIAMFLFVYGVTYSIAFVKMIFDEKKFRIPEIVKGVPARI